MGPARGSFRAFELTLSSGAHARRALTRFSTNLSHRLLNMNTVHATLLTSLLIGCASSTAPETADKSDCDVVDLGTQPTNRLPTGDVLWLPSAAGPDCDLEWSLDSGEDGTLLSNDAGFFARQPGTYELTENTTVPASASPRSTAPSSPFTT